LRCRYTRRSSPNVEPLTDVAVSVTDAPLMQSAVHGAPQLMPVDVGMLPTKVDVSSSD
jgi:hypothetical protein